MLEEMKKNNFIMVVKNNPLCIVCSVIYYFIGVWLYGGSNEGYLIMLVFYLFFLLIALSFIGEEILKFLERARKIETKREKELLLPIFEEVYGEAKQRYPDLGRIEICVIDKMTVNACALGKHTVAVTKGAIETFSEGELRAIIAHEIAHIINHDTMARLYVTIGNGFFTLIAIGLKMISYIIKVMQDIAEASKLAKYFFTFLMFFCEGFIAIITFLMQITISINSRQNEFRADKFAHELEYGEDMINALYLLEKIQLEDNSDIMQRMIASHPRTTKRIGRLEALVETDE